ncbi:MAG: hypothetical protein JRI45_10245, partial [Deltaproteobacteria bacterium]|nr:hypothetical protein [Deltaproteobacteria bacterium]
MASGIYDVFKGDLMEKQVDIGDGGDTIQVALLDDSHSFTSSDATWSDVNANEISGTGYTASGATLAGQTVTEGATTKFDGTDTTWTTASFTAYHAVLFDDTNSESLICSIDFGGAKTVSAGTFTIQWNA